MSNHSRTHFPFFHTASAIPSSSQCPSFDTQQHDVHVETLLLKALTFAFACKNMKIGLIIARGLSCLIVTRPLV